MSSHPLEPWVRARLRCPVCRAELLDVPEGLRCSAGECGAAYRVDELGIPVLLVEDLGHQS